MTAVVLTGTDTLDPITFTFGGLTHENDNENHAAGIPRENPRHPHRQNHGGQDQLHAADLVGQSSKELITRLYNREGYKVLEIGKAEKQSGELNLEAAYLVGHFMEDGGAEAEL